MQLSEYMGPCSIAASSVEFSLAPEHHVQRRIASTEARTQFCQEAPSGFEDKSDGREQAHPCMKLMQARTASCGLHSP